VVFVDSNVPMYVVGASHPNRDRLEEFFRSHAEETYVTSAEVYQEVIHRYVVINRREAILDCFTFLDGVVRHVYPITRRDAERAATIVRGERRLSGRDALHVSVMERYGVEQILTLDEDFDFWPGISRLPRPSA
jgi:predicted nucleic acid-binding protein